MSDEPRKTRSTAANESRSGEHDESRDEPQDSSEQNIDDKPHSKPLYKRTLLMGGILLVGLVIAVGAFVWWLHARHYESTDDAFIDGHTVQVAPKISGYVAKLLVTDNQLVEASQLLLEIDARDQEVALAEAQAAEASAQGSVAQAKARIDAAIAQSEADDAQVIAADAVELNAKQDVSRNRRLAPRGVSQQTLDLSEATSRSTTAQSTAARARATASEEQVKLAKTQLLTAEADLQQARVRVDQAKLNLSYTKITAPIRGRVTHRTVELGNYLEAAQPLFALVDPEVWVTADFKETQLTDIRVGQPVEVTIDAFPDRTLKAHVDSIQRGSGARFSALPPENATGNYVKVVQRVPVKIVFDEPLPNDMVLGPGMSVVPTVTVR
jgi:membrane fusion protein (multidrug efflux system)